MDVAESLINKSLYKIELLLIKSIPFVLALICFVNTTLSFLNIDLPVLSYIGGVSLLPLLFLYISSFLFKFCIYHILNTIVHEAKHVQSNICKYYDIEEDSEDAAYLIGYIIQRMHRVFRNMISTGKR